MAEQTRPHILVVDDNSEIREIIDVLLTGEGYVVIGAADGREALEQLKTTDFDLIILDIMMPGIDGYETCRSIRERSNVPVLFLSARTSGSDKLFGFSSGGDDYLVKPFSYEELVGRTKALIRRYHIYQGKGTAVAQTAASSISYRELTIDTSQGEVLLNGQLVELTDTEYQILKLLVANRSRIFSAQHLYESIWNELYYYGANSTIMVHIRNLRKKIERDPQNPVYIKTAWGKGYHCG